MEQMDDNARLRAVQERRRGMEAARRAQDDYERMQSDLLHQRIAPLRTLGYQTNERRRIAQTILNEKSAQAVPAAWTARQDPSA